MEGDGGDRGNDTVIIQPVKLVKSLQGLCRYSNVGSIPTKGSQFCSYASVLNEVGPSG